MRIQHWYKAVLSLLAPLAVAASSLAQSPPPYAGPNPGIPPYGPPGAYPPSGASAYAPWPAVSPHLGPNIMQEQTSYRDGNWLKEVLFRDRDWYFSTEYIHSAFDGLGGARIGSRPARLNPTSNDFNQINTWPDGPPIGNGGGLAVQVGPGAFPYVFVQEEVDGFVGLAILQPPEIFPIRTVNILGEDIDSNGMRFRGGFFESDGSGLGFDAWWGLKGDDFVQYGQSRIGRIPITQDLIAGIDTSGLFPSEIDSPFGGFIPFTKVGAVPYEENSGVIDILFPGSGFTGSTQKYDLLYRVDAAVEGGGGDLNYYLGHIFRREAVSLNAFVGLKYLRVDEYFGFHGLDSGFGYVVQLDPDEALFRPEDGTLIGPLYPLFETVVESKTRTHIAGPQVGVRGDIGRSKRFKLWWQGAAGLTVNHERTEVEGFNAGNAHFFNNNPGDPTDPDDDTGFGTIFGPAFDMFSNDTRFDDIEYHTHVSPTLQLGLNVEFDLFEMIPWTKRMSLFDKAMFTAGHNVIVVGELARPADSIKWRGFPQFPEVRVRRDTFDIQQFSLGVTFER